MPLSVFDTPDGVADNPTMLAISAYPPLDRDPPTSLIKLLLSIYVCQR